MWATCKTHAPGCVLDGHQRITNGHNIPKHRLNVQDASDTAKHSDFVSLLGVATEDPNNFMKTKGQEVGREIMSKLMHSVYQDDGLEPPGDPVGACTGLECAVACDVDEALRRMSPFRARTGQSCTCTCSIRHVE